jgi:hypothetical protein
VAAAEHVDPAAERHMARCQQNAPAPAAVSQIIYLPTANPLSVR